MKIEIWSDIVCPWCGLNHHRWQRLLREHGYQDRVEVVYRSFQLDPTAPAGVTLPVREMLRDKLGLDAAGVAQATGTVEELAARDGISPFVVLENTTGSTQLTHEFLAHASAEGSHAEAWDLMFRAYFGAARPVFDVDALVGLGAELGLDADGTRQALTGRRYRDQVAQEAAEAVRLGARGVPFTVIDRAYGIPGAQEGEVLLDVLRKVSQESRA